jgi:hypothetical protein
MLTNILYLSVSSYILTQRVCVAPEKWQSTLAAAPQHEHAAAYDVVLTALNGTTAVQSQPLQKAPCKWR